jgi:hypothetical protein
MRPVSTRDPWNARRYAADGRGHYESWFLRGNHPERPLAFWIRYTIFAPRGAPEKAEGELWAIAFDGEREQIVVGKREVPIAACEFSDRGLAVDIENATLRDGHARGAAETIAWDLSYEVGDPPLLLLPRARYEARFPKAKSVVSAPMARFTGGLEIAGEPWPIDDWVGSQNHNWGSQHTDRYAWGQVAGFDDEPDAFLECITARVRLGPLHTPWVTLANLRVAGEQHTLVGLLHGALAKSDLGYFFWEFDTSDRDTRIVARIEAPRSAFVALRYRNPPGGVKTCLNTKIARAEITLQTSAGTRTLVTKHRAAFEILTDDSSHGLRPVR